MRKHKNKIIAGIVIAIVFAFVFWYGGDTPGLRGWPPQPKEDAIIVQNDAPATKESKPLKQDGTPMTPAEKIAMAEKIAESTQSSTEETTSSVEIKTSNEEYFKEQGMVKNEVIGQDKNGNEPVFEGKPVPIEPENAVITERKFTCTLSVRCDTILKNIGWLDSGKVDIVPKDGVVFAEKSVTFYEGESVFNLLMREMKRNKIHLEFENTPIYNSAYIEGIANLYEFDCGELSGWMYKVNDWFPNYGCSRYQLKAGDKVEWVYTCDLGNDVGGHYSARNGK